MSISLLGAAAIGAGINTVGGIASSILNNSSARAAEDRSYERSLRLMQSQNQWNLARWREANVYNSPANQLKLIQEAGINPALFDMAGQQPASEVTSSEASVPYDSQARHAYDGLGLNQLGNGVIQALQVDALIAKLRTDIKYQNLVNRDLENQLKAKETPMENLQDFQDSEGSWTIYPETNYYDEERQGHRINVKRSAVGSAREYEEFKGYLEDYPFLRSLTQEQLKSLSTDIRSKSLNNELLEEDVRMMKKYGISSQDKNEWTALLRAALHDPDNISRILDALGSASARTFEHLFEGFGRGFSHRNPPSGSW